jgi:hypothetical protein
MTTTSFVPNRSTTAGELTRLHIEGEMMMYHSSDAVGPRLTGISCEHGVDRTKSVCGMCDAFAVSSLNRPTITENPQPVRRGFVQGMQHRCKHIDYNDTSLRIEGRLDQQWWMFDPDDYDVEDEVINYCPFCGEKLPEITA